LIKKSFLLEKEAWKPESFELSAALMFISLFVCYEIKFFWGMFEHFTSSFTITAFHFRKVHFYEGCADNFPLCKFNNLTNLAIPNEKRSFCEIPKDDGSRVWN
jgi:hypothetical protein